MLGESEVGKNCSESLQSGVRFIFVVKQDVCWFDVAMDNVLMFKVGQSRRELKCKALHRFFLEHELLSFHCLQVFAVAILQDEV